MGGESLAVFSQALSPSHVVDVFKALDLMDGCDDVSDALEKVDHMDGPDLDVPKFPARTELPAPSTPLPPAN